MKIVGLITEYNPFHSGHAYHIQKSRELSGADYVVVLMSGDFVQRGTPAIFDKRVRTKMALACGADLVLELPLTSACASAEYFAKGAVEIFTKLGCIDSICFGSEAPDIDRIMFLADILHSEPASYQNLLKENLRHGMTFPCARSDALAAYCHLERIGFSVSSDEISTFLKSPNNILALEYCKAILSLKSPIKPLTIERADSQYHDTQTAEQYSSATALRKLLFEEASDDFPSSIKKHIPSDAFDSLLHWPYKICPIDENDFSMLLNYKLMLENRTSITKYMDVSNDLAERIYNRLNLFSDYKGFINTLKTKEITYTRIQRALLHILLEIESPLPLSYVRILGLQRESSFLLHELKKHSQIPMVSKLSDRNSTMAKEIQAANLYEMIAAHKGNRPFVHELSKPIITV